MNVDELKQQLLECLQAEDLDNTQMLSLTHQIANFDESKIRFSVDAGVIDRLGQELVARQETAVSELVKNSYDADAEYVSLKFCDSKEIGGVLIIEDDGHGMSHNDLVNGFMRVSSTSKIHEPTSPLFNRKRAGQKGISFTFVTPREREYLELIEDTTKSKMLKQHVPSIGDAKDARYRQAAQKLIGIAESAKTHDLEEAAQKLLEEYDAVKLVSAALKMVTKQSSDAPVTLTDESPVRMKKKPMKSSGSRYSKDSKPGSGSSSYKGKGKSYSNSSKKYPASKSQGSSKTERAEKSDNYRKRKTSHNHSNKTTI